MSDFTIEDVLYDKERMKKSIEIAINNFMERHPNVTPSIKIKIERISEQDESKTKSVVTRIDLKL